MTDMQKKDLANRTSNASGVIVDWGQQRKKDAILHAIPARFAKKHEECTIHIHDLEFYDVVYNCLGVHVRDLVGTASRTFAHMLRALFRGITALTNDQSGGIGFLQFMAGEFIILPFQTLMILAESTRFIHHGSAPSGSP